jgi:hypothetical protein
MSRQFPVCGECASLPLPPEPVFVRALVVTSDHDSELEAMTLMP